MTVDGYSTHARAVGQLPLDPCDGECIRRSDARLFTRLHAQKAKLVAAGMTAQASARIAGDLDTRVVDSNPAGEENFGFTRGAEVADAGIFQHEGTFFWTEESEPHEID